MNKSSNSDRSTTSDELHELRSLLLGLEPTKLEKIYERLDNPKITAEDISRLLPEAAHLRAEDPQLSDAIVPTVEQAIQVSIQKDQDVLATAIFPILGPATRKAAVAALQEMIQSLDRTLEFSFSPQSLKWRLEALMTGKTFAQVVLLRTLVYQVEQVFLIHKNNGLLLQHIVAPQVVIQDPDLVSAMLTAIQDFVRDSFNIQKEDALHSLYFGELTIWVEEGPQAVLAGIIRGNAPQELRLVFQDAIEKIHQKLNRELIAFEGDTEPFADSKPFLEACLAFQYKYLEKKNSPYALTLLGAMVFGVGIWGFFAIRNHMRWNSFIEQLDAQPGIVVIKAETRFGKYFLSGMRDSLAVDPNTLIKQAHLNPKIIISRWERYLSFEPQITAKRSVEFLKPPKTVSLAVDEKGILHASGSAPHQWILETRKQWHSIPGVTQFQYQNLVDIELSQLNDSKKKIEQTILLFFQGKTEFLSGEEKKFQNLVMEMENLLKTAKHIGKDIRIQIIGYTDGTGTEDRNMILSQARADKILFSLSTQGINSSHLSAVGAGNRQTLRTGFVEEDKSYNRRVSFKVFLSEMTK
ncbi:hypothetical protein NUACC21_23300 [Scytonema sp. NUACC21]